MKLVHLKSPEFIEVANTLADSELDQLISHLNAIKASRVGKGVTIRILGPDESLTQEELVARSDIVMVSHQNGFSKDDYVAANTTSTKAVVQPFDESVAPLLYSLDQDTQMTMKQLLDVLSELVLRVYSLHVVKNGFGSGSTYRGYYDQVAFEPKENVTIGSMYTAVFGMQKGSLQGKNSHDTPVTDYTLVNIAEYNDCGEDDELTPRRLKAMLGIVES